MSENEHNTTGWDREQVRREAEKSRSGAQHAQGQRPPQRRRKKKRGNPILGFLIYIVFVVVSSALLAGVGWLLANDLCALNKEMAEATIEVTKEDNVNSVATKLKEAGLIEYKWFFKLFAWVSSADEKIGEGTYTLTTDMDYRALLAGMRANSANRAQVRVTIPEGYTTDQIFSLLEEEGGSTVQDLREAAAEHDYAFDFLQDIPLGDYHRLEGYLMPATYDFYTPHDPIYALNKLLVYFDSQVINDSMAAQVEASGYSLREILTIASMIERETTGEDRTDIASVIYNRLSNQDGGTMGFLQIDATLVYINGGKEPTAADREIDSPYNTYKYKGLPPGPIANPGMESIVAALNPADSNNYYYALGDDEVHHFFRTYDQLQKFINSQERYK